MIARRTRQKQIVLDAISGIGVHMTAEEVYGKIHQEDPTIGIATVYRNLNRMCEEGLIQKVNENGCCFYDGNPTPHDHFICDSCGEVVDILDLYEAELDQKLEKTLGVYSVHHHTIYRGICSTCKNKNKN